MKKIFTTLFLTLIFCSKSFAQSYYFNNCDLTEKYFGNFLVNFNKKVVKVNFVGIKDDFFKEIIIPIEKITKKEVISEKVKGTGSDMYFQVFLNSETKRVSIQNFLYQDEKFNLHGIRSENDCKEVEANWSEVTGAEELKEKLFGELKKELEGNDNQNETNNEESKKEKKIKIKSSLPTCKGNTLKKWTNCLGTLHAFEYTYTGEWKDGKVHGKGHEKWNDGREYFGEFKNDKRHGQGTAKYSDGSTYIGGWKNGKREGKGEHKFVSGIIYYGEFEDGEIIEGIAYYPDGTKYEGEFLFGKPKEEELAKKNNIALLLANGLNLLEIPLNQEKK